MFKFDFDIEDADDEVVIPQAAAPAASAAASSSQAAVTRAPAQPSHSISLADLIKTLPASFSYSPLAHPCGPERAPLLRRDLFDARFQLAQAGEDDEDDEGFSEEGKGKAVAAEDKSGEAEGAEYVDADTDLVPGTYEGGLKSWEGGVDLVEVIASSVASGSRSEEEEDAKVAAWVRGARVLEVGCGTGLPSAYLLRSLLFSPPTAGQRTTLHLQDYNLPVLSLVTLPNLVLAALGALPADVLAGATTTDVEVEHEASAEDEDADEYADEAEDAFGDGEGEKRQRAPKRAEVDGFNPRRAGTLDLTPRLVQAFTTLLEERGIELLFTYGDWSGMAKTLAGEEAYTLVLTAETIYAEESQGPLLDVLQAAARGTPATHPVPENDASLEKSLSSLSVRDEWAHTPLAANKGDPLVLVAAKVLYFGVGGDLESFLQFVVKERGGWSTRVKDWVRGVGRAVVRVGWH